MPDDPEAPGSPNKPQNLLHWFATHPLVGLFGSVASIIGIPLALYFFVASQPSRELVIFSDPATTIVDAREAGSVDILYHGEKITTDVYARHLYLWNAGNDSIRRENILEPITLSIPHATILETRVRKLSRPLTAIRVDSSGGDAVTVSWNILERYDGAYIDIIYAAQKVSKFVAHGSIEHQRNLEWGEYDRRLTRNDTELVRKVAGVILIIIAGGLVRLCYNQVQWFRKSDRTLWKFMVTMVIPLVALGFASYGLWMAYKMFVTDMIPPLF